VLPQVDPGLYCRDCKSFLIPTQDSKGALCPNGHGRVLCTKPEGYAGTFTDFYREHAKRHSLLPWLSAIPEAWLGKYGHHIQGQGGIYRRRGKLKAHEQPPQGLVAGRESGEAYSFERIATEGYIPLARPTGSIKDWQGNMLPEASLFLTDGRMIVDKTQLAEKARGQLLKVQATRTLPEEPKSLAVIMARSTPAEVLGIQEETLHVKADQPYCFKAEFAAWLNRHLKPDAFGVFSLAGKAGKQIAWLQFIVEGTVVAALAERDQ
jgi:hypothetical protein